MAYECISSFLQHKCNNVLHKAVNALNNKANIQQNKLMKLDDTMLMYGIYNAETLEKLITTVHKIRNCLPENTIILYLEYFMHTP